MIVLEELGRAEAGGAKIYAELLGYGVRRTRRTSPIRSNRCQSCARPADGVR